MERPDFQLSFVLTIKIIIIVVVAAVVVLTAIIYNCLFSRIVLYFSVLWYFSMHLTKTEALRRTLVLL